MSAKQFFGLVFVFAMLLSASGCTTPLQISKQVEITGLDFDKNITYTGPTIRSYGDRSSIDDVQFARLLAKRSKMTGEIKYYVSAEVFYPSGLRYYRKAVFADSTKVRTNTQWFAENPCVEEGCYRHYALNFPVQASQLNEEDGPLKFRLESLAGKINVFSIPWVHKKGFMMASEKHDNVGVTAKVESVPPVPPVPPVPESAALTSMPAPNSLSIPVINTFPRVDELPPVMDSLKKR